LELFAVNQQIDFMRVFELVELRIDNIKRKIKSIDWKYENLPFGVMQDF